MIKVAFVRGKYINPFEAQNYVFDPSDIQIEGVSSLKPLNGTLPFPLIKLPSLADFENPLVKFGANRTLGDMHQLTGLENLKNSFDIFHTADPYFYFSYQLALLRSKNRIKKLVSTVWETIPFNNEGTRSKKRIKNYTKEHIDLFITYSKKARNALLQEGIPDSKIRQIYLGVDVLKFVPVNKEHMSTVHVLWVGRDVPEKGLQDVKKAAAKVGKNIRLLTVSGNVEYDKMPEMYHHADIFVMPSKKTDTWEEQYGMVLVEAMASGLPIIGYDTGVIKELVGDAGMVIQPDSENLAKALSRLQNDISLRSTLSMKARARAESLYNSHLTANKIGTIYHELI